MSAQQPVTAYAQDGTPIIVNVQVQQPKGESSSTSAASPPSTATGVIQPKVAHVGDKEAPLNTETPRGPSDTTASLANLTTGLAGMVLTAPAAALEKVAPVLTEKLTVAGQAAAVHAQNAGNFVVNKASGAAATTSNVASNVATTVQDGTVNAASTVQQSTANAASTVQQSTANAASTVQDKAAVVGQSLPSSTAEAGAQAQSLLAQAASYLPTSIQSVLPESITGSHSTLGTKDSPLAPYTTPVADKAANASAQAQDKAANASAQVQNVASSIGTKDSPLAPYTTPVVDKAHGVASRAENATATSGNTGSQVTPGSSTNASARIPSGAIDSGVSDIGRDSHAPQVNVAGQNTPAPYSTGSASSAARVDLDRHRDNASFATPDSKVDQAKSALSNSAFTDAGRQSTTDRAAAAAKPDSQKTYTEIAADTVKGKADDLASYAQTDSNKSYTQQAADALSSNKSATSSSHGLTDAGRQSATDRFSSAAKPDSQKTYTEIAADTVKGKADDLASYVQPDSNKSLGQSIADTVGTKKQS